MRLIDNYKLKKDLKWIVVLGGNLSGIGKGIAAASIGRLLKDSRKIVPIKCDGYLNEDPGTIHPLEHGEVFVLEDGGEVDMDFGHYERFLGVNCKKSFNITMGKIYKEVLENERRGDYLGQTVQVMPHVTDQIKRHLFETAQGENADIIIVEIGGTVGDMENQLYIEAVKELRMDIGKDNIIYVMVTEVPIIKGVNEQKSKPTQIAVRQLESQGIHPDIIIGRCDEPVSDSIKQKIMAFCTVDFVASSHFLPTVYELPISFYEQGMLQALNKGLSIETKPSMDNWKELVHNMLHPTKEINVAICGKYTRLEDAYASIHEALKHSGANLSSAVKMYMVDTRELDTKPEKAGELLKNADAVIIPGGFSTQGVEGMITVAKYAREHKLPFLGICYGLQMAVIEFTRNVCRLAGANTTEVDPGTKNPVVAILEEQKSITSKGGTMRLGAYPALIKKGTIINEIYKSENVSERHRHRYEVNPSYHNILQEKGLVISGLSPDGSLAEFIELPKVTHPYFVATQAHPELKSRLESPAPMFFGLVKAALDYRKNKK